MAGGISLLLASCGGATAKKAAAIKPAGSDLGAVEHVVFLMHENRSFDHYFGTYRGVRGFDDARARRRRALRPGVARRCGPDAAPLPSRHGHHRGRVHLRPVPPVGRPAPVLEQREDGQLRRRPHRAALRGTGERRPHHGVLHAPGSRLLLRAGRRLHHLRRLPLLGHGTDPPQPPPRPVGDARSGRATPAGPSSSPTAPPSAQGSATLVDDARGTGGRRCLVEGLQRAGTRLPTDAPVSPWPSRTTSCSTSSSTWTRRRRSTRRPSGPSSRTTSSATSPTTGCRRCRGSHRPTATTSTRPRPRRSGCGSPTT